LLSNALLEVVSSILTHYGVVALGCCHDMVVNSSEVSSLLYFMGFSILLEITDILREGALKNGRILLVICDVF
jgi:hypothetical protein